MTVCGGGRIPWAIVVVKFQPLLSYSNTVSNSQCGTSFKHASLLSAAILARFFTFIVQLFMICYEIEGEGDSRRVVSQWGTRKGECALFPDFLHIPW